MKNLRPGSNFRTTVLLFQFALFMAAAASGAADGTYIGYSDYQIATDSTFDAETHFKEMKEHGVNFQRIWVLGYSNSIPYKRERMPFARKGRLYNLDQLDATYLNRLRSILTSAQKYDQQVMLTLFDRWSMTVPDVWVQSPWYYKNNTTRRLLRSPLPAFYDLEQNPRLSRLQENYVKAIVEATAEFDPVYEIMNEASLSGNCGLLARWHRQVAGWIRDESPQSRVAVNVIRGCGAINLEPWVDIVSFHGAEWREAGICGLIKRHRAAGKTVIIDTDGAWRTRDDNRLVRTWLQQTLRCGGSFNHKDDIYAPDYQALELFKALGNSTQRPQRARRKK